MSCREVGNEWEASLTFPRMDSPFHAKACILDIPSPRRSREGSARGFNPVSTLGTDHPERRALKGRQIERTNKAEVETSCSTSQLCALVLCTTLGAKFT
jgi:hypothetical protein